MKSNITKESYLKTAQAFVGSNDGGFVIALFDGRKADVEFKATIRQWGAWRAYFWGIGHKGMVRFMDAHGSEKNACLTVPAEWPHLFDAAATVQGDHEAGERFARNHRPERLDMAGLARRMATVAAYRSRLPRDARRGTWEPKPEVASGLIDKDALLAGYEREFGDGA